MRSLPPPTACARARHIRAGVSLLSGGACARSTRAPASAKARGLTRAHVDGRWQGCATPRPPRGTRAAPGAHILLDAPELRVGGDAHLYERLVEHYAVAIALSVAQHAVAVEEQRLGQSQLRRARATARPGAARRRAAPPAARRPRGGWAWKREPSLSGLARLPRCSLAASSPAPRLAATARVRPARSQCYGWIRCGPPEPYAPFLTPIL